MSQNQAISSHAETERKEAIQLVLSPQNRTKLSLLLEKSFYSTSTSSISFQKDTKDVDFSKNLKASSKTNRSSMKWAIFDQVLMLMATVLFFCTERQTCVLLLI